jgi:hypothetical protein
MIPMDHEQRRVLGACLRSPSRFLPIVRSILNGGGGLDVTTRKVLSVIRPDDADQASVEVSMRLEGDPNWPAMVPDWTTPALWLPDLEAAGWNETEFTIEETVRLIGERFRQGKIGAMLTDAGLRIRENPHTADDVWESLRAMKESADLSAPNRYRTASISALDLSTKELEQPRATLGSGLITATDYWLIFGKPGLGKSFLTLQLALAVARGETFFGLQVTKGRVGIVSLEVPEFYVRERMRPMIHMAEDWPKDVLIMACDSLKGLSDLSSPRERAEIAAMCKGEGLSILVVDPLAAAHPGEETHRDFAPIVRGLKEIALQTGTAPGVVHHERKGQADDKDSEDLACLRGAAMLGDFAGCAMRLVASRGKICLRFAKVRYQIAPAEIWLGRDQNGILFEVEPPEDLHAKGEANREKVRQAAVPGCWYSSAALSEATGLNQNTLWRHLKALGAVQRGSTRTAEWCIPDPNQDSGLIAADADF